MFDQIKTVLVLAPHPDDAEFGMGATLAKLIELGKEVHIAVFSTCEQSTPEGFAPGSIMRELRVSCGLLGVSAERLRTFDFSVRKFPELRQEILEELIVLKREIQPDLVCVPSSTDVHQDHQTIHAEGLRAFKDVSVLGYELPWNNFEYPTDVFVNLEERHLARKLECLASYETQKGRGYCDPEFVRAMARFRGGQVKKQHAEAFELLRFYHH